MLLVLALHFFTFSLTYSCFSIPVFWGSEKKKKQPVTGKEWVGRAKGREVVRESGDLWIQGEYNPHAERGTVWIISEMNQTVHTRERKSGRREKRKWTIVEQISEEESAGKSAYRSLLSCVVMHFNTQAYILSWTDGKQVSFWGLTEVLSFLFFWNVFILICFNNNRWQLHKKMESW